MKPSWRDQANCKTTPTGLFFNDPIPEQTLAMLRSVCGACPVIAECRDAADDGYEYGFWAGETHKERRQRRAFGPGVGRADGRLRRGPFNASSTLVEGFPKPSKASHGSHARYVSGCRCDGCRNGERVYQRNRDRARRAG